MTDWTEVEADWIGMSVLIGLTWLNADESFDAQEQMHGRIVSASRTEGFVIALEGKGAGQTYSLPPDLRSFKPAPAGEYRLKSTGEVLVDPDLLTSWTITRPARV